jgi:hypothetical protein
MLRLPLEVRPCSSDWLLRHYPDRYRHVMSLIRSMRDGKDYDAEWGKRMKGSGPYAWQIGRRFEIAARRLGLNTNTNPSGDLPPPRSRRRLPGSPQTSGNGLRRIGADASLAAQWHACAPILLLFSTCRSGLIFRPSSARASAANGPSPEPTRRDAAPWLARLSQLRSSLIRIAFLRALTIRNACRRTSVKASTA